MRRAFATVTALAIVLIVAAPVAAKGPPEIVPLDPSVFDEEFLAGTCDFRVELVDSFSNSKLMLFPVEDDGSQLMRSTGGYVSTLRNLDNGNEIELNYKSMIDFDVQADGSIRISSSGSVFIYTFVGDDISIFEPGLYLVTGRTHSVVGPDGFALEPEVIRGQVVDLCAAIA